MMVNYQTRMISFPLPYLTCSSHDLFLFRKPGDDRTGVIGKPKGKEGTQEKAEKLILCKFCHHRIARKESIIEVNGRHSHVFSNPSGYVFTIGCFSVAEGCVNQGAPTMEFTWFEGYSWRFSLCANCRAHLGWFFQGGGEKSFFGLILDRLVEGN